MEKNAIFSIKVSSNNRIKRFIYACCAKIYHEKYDDSIHAFMQN
jgi:hypothetical protein